MLELGERVARKWQHEQDQGPFAAVPPAQRRATITKDVNAKDDAGNPIDGLVMFKHPVNGVPNPPQLRPDSDPDVTWHDHSDYSPAVRKRHEGGRKHHRRGVRVKGNHPHRHGKYKIAASPKTTVYYFQAHPIRLPRSGCRHKPGCSTSEEHTLKHVKKHHPTGDDTGGLTHRHERRVPDENRDSYGQRIDMHPFTQERLDRGEKPEWWWFCLEGNLKNDALVCRGEFVVNVPSVTLWPAPELEDFARDHLQGLPVFVVPDSDWTDNEMVASQTFLCIDALERFGVKAYVASPTPEPGWCELHGKEVCEPHGNQHCEEIDCRKRGLDDYVADRGDLLEMPVIIRRLTPEFDQWKAKVRGDRRLGEIRARERLIDVTGWAALHADEHGRVVKPGEKIAHYTGTSLDRIEGAINGLTMLAGIQERFPDLPEPPFAVTERELDAWERARDILGRAWKVTTIEVRRELRAKTIPDLTVAKILKSPRKQEEALAS